MNFRTAWIWTILDVRRWPWDFFVNTIASTRFCPRILRYCIYRSVGLCIRTPSIQCGLRFDSKNVTIGRRTFVNHSCAFESEGHITIGDNCQIGFDVCFCTAEHVIGALDRRCGDLVIKDIVVGDGVWIGARSIILAGVQIGNGCVVGAGSVVNKDAAPNTLIGGVPAKEIRTL